MEVPKCSFWPPRRRSHLIGVLFGVTFKLVDACAAPEACYHITPFALSPIAINYSHPPTLGSLPVASPAPPHCTVGASSDASRGPAAVARISLDSPWRQSLRSRGITHHHHGPKPRAHLTVKHVLLASCSSLLISFIETKSTSLACRQS